MSKNLYTSSENKAPTDEVTGEKLPYSRHLHLGDGMTDGSGAVKKMSPPGAIFTMSISHPMFLLISAILCVLFTMAFITREPRSYGKPGITPEQFNQLLHRIEELSKEVKELRRQ
ncbi:uncharacterized protein I303_100343 [Kwoniella dejecticola CBS 10117]|uniref:Uncharacterized protein n=1 Tax=Kwoniella dejecticola CBS 10117 TaxID=1296121 RepID=A0A1A6AEM7_9TREE|nr:uncharacterized protein I303_00343 [Kwoniella dejecticola CBS 10117]OBR88526.1 hypothetical protein I303_00343 [Kwoniella dejecticola CBS 10117]